MKQVKDDEQLIKVRALKKSKGKAVILPLTSSSFAHAITGLQD